MTLSPRRRCALHGAFHSHVASDSDRITTKPEPWGEGRIQGPTPKVSTRTEFDAVEGRVVWRIGLAMVVWRGISSPLKPLIDSDAPWGHLPTPCGFVSPSTSPIS